MDEKSLVLVTDLKEGQIFQKIRRESLAMTQGSWISRWGRHWSHVRKYGFNVYEVYVLNQWVPEQSPCKGQLNLTGTYYLISKGFFFYVYFSILD